MGGRGKKEGFLRGPEKKLQKKGRRVRNGIKEPPCRNQTTLHNKKKSDVGEEGLRRKNPLKVNPLLLKVTRQEVFGRGGNNGKVGEFSTKDLNSPFTICGGRIGPSPRHRH